MGSGYDDILSVQLTRNKTSSIGRESREGRYVRGGRMVSDFTCPSEIRCFYPTSTCYVGTVTLDFYATVLQDQCVTQAFPDRGTDPYL